MGGRQWNLHVSVSERTHICSPQMLAKRLIKKMGANYNPIEFVHLILQASTQDTSMMQNGKNLRPMRTNIGAVSLRSCPAFIERELFVKLKVKRYYQNEDHSGSRPHSFPGYPRLCFGMFPERFRSASVNVGSEESRLI